MTRKQLLKELSEAKTSFDAQYIQDELFALDKLTDLEEQSKANKESTDFHGDFKLMNEDKQDDIINPAHYKVIPSGSYPDGLEYMDLMTYILSHHNGVESHLLGQILKYAIRIGKKDDKLQDARKIEWYASYLVKVIKDES